MLVCKALHASTLLLTLTLLSSPRLVHAQDDPSLDGLELDLARRVGLPGGFDLSSALLHTSPGGMALANTVGVDRAARCVIVVVQDDAASALTYRHQDAPTACVSVHMGDGGEVFVRGFDPTMMNPQIATGFTSSLTQGGELKWFISDRELVEATSSAQGGTGEFIGDYGGPLRTMAYQGGEEPVLMAFTQGGLRMGFSVRNVPQAHLIEVDSGRLTRSGQGFGLGGAGNIAGAWTWPGDAYEGYLLVEPSIDGRGATFYRFNGRSRVELYEPGDEDWSRRRILQISTDAVRGEIALLWVPAENQKGAARLSVIQADANTPRFEALLAPQLLEEDGSSVELGLPVNLTFGRDYSVVFYTLAGSTYVRLLDTTTGQLVGGAMQDMLAVEHGVLGFSRAEDGTLRVLEWDRGQPAIEEYRLLPLGMEGTEEMGSENPDMGGVDQGSGFEAEAPIDGFEGSALCMMSPRRAMPGLPPVWLLGLGVCVMGVVRRRRRDR